MRKKYGIGKNTPMVIEDQGNGTLLVKVKQMIDYDDIEYHEKPGRIGLKFKNGIDPRFLIKEIDKLDG